MDLDKGINVDDMNNSLKRFGLADYAVFVFMLIMCSLVGIYFGYKDHKKQQRNSLKSRRGSGELDYLVGGRNMQIFPVAMSLVASGLSGITLLGMPAEVYVYGINIIYIVPPMFMLFLFVHYVIIPVFHNLQIVSTYEYLKQRFNNKVRLFGSLLFLLNNIIWLPIVIYVPSLSFNQTTGINVHVISVFVCLVCIFYTLLGGIKAVVWTDLIQVLIMYGSFTVILVNGVMDVGSLSTVIEKNLNSTRLDLPKLGFNLAERHSAFALFIGGIFMNINLFGMNQAMVQRYMSLPSVKAARRALLWNIAGAILMIAMCSLCGLVLYAKYSDCDPLTTGLITAKDQLVPLLVMENLNIFPGFAGLFIAGVFSASLSSLSTAMNSAAAVVLEDFWKPNTKQELTEKKKAVIMRSTVFIMGAVSVALVSVVQKLGGVLHLCMSMTSATLGPLLGIFCIGFFLPWIKSKGALIGAIVSIIFSMYVAIRAQIANASGEYMYETKPTSVEGCSYNFVMKNSTKTPFLESSDISPELHQMSYMYYTFFGCLLTILVGFIVSLIDKDIDPTKVETKLLAPFMRKYFQTEVSHYDEVKIQTKHVFDVKDNMLIVEAVRENER